MFRLLYIFSQGDKKNNFAPQLYKNLSFSLIDNHSDSNTREYIMVNLMKVFDSYPKIPIGMIVEPVVKQLQLGEGDSYVYNSYDFCFFAKLANHPTLTPTHALYLIDSMAKIYINDFAYANSAAIPFMAIATRFLRHEDIFNFIVKFLTMLFSMLPELEKKKATKQEESKGKKPILVGKLAEEQKERE